MASIMKMHVKTKLIISNVLINSLVEVSEYKPKDITFNTIMAIIISSKWTESTIN